MQETPHFSKKLQIQLTTKYSFETVLASNVVAIIVKQNLKTKKMEELPLYNPT
jgi:hypothetical protein